MALPIGQKLREARLSRGLSLEDVQHQTRISRAMLVAMENDDLGSFDSPTYARKFFAAYAHHLGVDARDFLGRFHPHGLQGVVDYQAYLQKPTDRVHSAKTPRRPGMVTMLLIALALLGLTALAAYWAGRLSSPSPDPAPQPTATPAGPTSR
jgi:cytoskeleton protein RodZ